MLFTHGGILQHILAALIVSRRTWSVATGNTAVFDFDIDRAAWRRDLAEGTSLSSFKILAFNDTSHLGSRSATRGPDDV